MLNFDTFGTYNIDYSNQHKHEMMADSTFAERINHYKAETWR